MTCPIESLESFFTNHWDVDSLCELMACRECTAEPGEGALWWMSDGPPSEPSPEAGAGDDDIPF